MNNSSTHLASNESVEFVGPIYQFDIDLFCQDTGIPKEKALSMPWVQDTLKENPDFYFPSIEKAPVCVYKSKMCTGNIRTAFVYYRSWCVPVRAWA